MFTRLVVLSLLLILCVADPIGCGVPRVLNRSRRIVNGTVARPGQWPWMVNVAKKDLYSYIVSYTNVCGGTLLTDRHVVTAAHCTVDNEENLSVILGGISRFRKTEEMNVTKIIEVDSIRRHDDFSFAYALYGVAVTNDIAVIVLKHPVTFTDYIRPICLPDPSTHFPGLRGTVAGWGKTSTVATLYPSTLRQVEVSILSRETCIEWYRRAGTNFCLWPDEICAGDEKGGKDACEKDSGGPLMVQDEGGRWVLAGIVSSGYGCGEPNQPGVYVSVSYYLPWIQQQLAL